MATAMEADKALVMGTLRLKLTEVSTRPTNWVLKSGTYEIGGLYWNLEANRFAVSGNKSDDVLDLFVRATSRSFTSYWSADVDQGFGIEGHENGEWVKKGDAATVTYAMKEPFWGEQDFIKWEELVDPAKCYLKEDSVVVSAKIVINKLVGISFTPPPTLNFREGIPFSDIILRVSGISEYEFTDFHASKALLSLHSPVFAAMFGEGFKEHSKNVVEIEEVEPTHFEIMLTFLYAPNRLSYLTHFKTNLSLGPETVEILVAMGDRFQVRVILDSMERYLLADRSFTTLHKLALCDRYHLPQLKVVVVNRMSLKEVRNMAKNEEFKSLSKDIRILVLQKLG